MATLIYTRHKEEVKADCLIKMHQRRRTLFNWLGSWWVQSITILMELSTSLIWPRIKLLQKRTTKRNWIVWNPSSKINGHDCRRKKLSSIRTAHRLTPPLSKYQKYKNWASNWFRISLHSANCFCSPTWKHGLEILVQRRLLLYVGISCRLRVIILFWRDGKVGIPLVSIQLLKDTMLRNKGKIKN